MPAACSVSAADAGREIRAGSWPEAIRSERRPLLFELRRPDCNIHSRRSAEPSNSLLD